MEERRRKMKKIIKLLDLASLILTLLLIIGAVKTEED